jgi:hypothetical protein
MLVLFSCILSHDDGTASTRHGMRHVQVIQQWKVLPLNGLILRGFVTKQRIHRTRQVVIALCVYRWVGVVVVAGKEEEKN